MFRPLPTVPSELIVLSILRAARPFILLPVSESVGTISNGFGGGGGGGGAAGGGGALGFDPPPHIVSSPIYLLVVNHTENVGSE